MNLHDSGLHTKIVIDSALNDSFAPELNIYMLMLWLLNARTLFSQRNRLAIKVFVQGDASKLEKRWDKIGVRGRERGDFARRDARPSRQEGNVDVLLLVASLAWRKPMLANVKPVVACVKEVGVGENVRVGLELRDDGADEVVDCLQRLEAAAVEEIVVLNLIVAKFWKSGEVVDGPGLLPDQWLVAK